jgi:hypothetical protein
MKAPRLQSSGLLARARTTALGAAILVVVTACSALAPVPTGSPSVAASVLPSLGPEATAKPNRQTIEPPYSAEPPSGPLTRIMGDTLSRDRRVLTVEFIGGFSYTRSDWCSVDHTGWARIEGDVLEVAIGTIPHPDQATSPPDGACSVVGYRYLFRIVLPERFDGTTVRDLGSGQLWLPPPERVADPALLPAAWSLIDVQGDALADPEPHVLFRTYGPLDPSAPRPIPTVVLAQAFGGPVRHPGGDAIGVVKIHGQSVPVHREPGSEEGLNVFWRLNGDAFALITYDASLTVEELAAIANAVAVPSS